MQSVVSAMPSACLCSAMVQERTKGDTLFLDICFPFYPYGTLKNLVVNAFSPALGMKSKDLSMLSKCVTN